MKKFLIAIACTFGILCWLFVLPVSAQTGDCDDNAIIRCGAFTASQLQTKTAGDVQDIYAHYGINSADFDSLEIGSVHKDGTVWVGSNQVATEAITAGRQNISGSTYLPSLKIYERPPSVSFRSNQLTAFVKMANGRFVYAIIQSCGNPVSATPVAPPPAPPPATPPPVTPPNHPSITISKLVSKPTVTLNEQFIYTVTVKNTGDQVLKNVAITDTPLDTIQFVPNETGVAQNHFSTTISSLPAGGSQTFNYSAKIVRQVEGEQMNTACVNVPDTPALHTCATALVQLAPAVTPPSIPTAVTTSVTKTETIVSPPVQTIASSKPAALPNTGAEAVIGLGASTSVGTYVGTLLYARLRRRFLL